MVVEFEGFGEGEGEQMRLDAGDPGHDVMLSQALTRTMEDVNTEEVSALYEKRLEALRSELAQQESKAASTGILLVGMMTACIALLVFAIRGQVSFWLFGLAVPLVVVALRRFQKEREKCGKISRLDRWYVRAVERIAGEWEGVGPDGAKFAEDEHLYAHDLNVLGRGSLFQLLCMARTAIGQRGLAQYLLVSPTIEESLLRQAAVLELRDRTELREKVVVLGPFETFESKWETFVDWLELPPLGIPPVLRIVGLCTSMALLVVGLLCAAQVVPWRDALTWVMPILAAQAAIGLQFRDRVNQMQSWLGSVSIEAQVLREGLQFFEAQSFTSPKLAALRERVQGSAAEMKRLEWMLNGMAERGKDWFYLPSLLMMAGTQLAMGIEVWRAQHQASLRGWLEAWGEFEALNSLACYAFENPENVVPDFEMRPTCFEAEEIGHPLLPGESCIRNNVELNEATRFFVISGSNMAGKSTLLRSIGLNAVLATAGAPVRAKKLRMSPVSVCASLSIVDSLLHGKSKFMAEMDRLRLTIESARRGEAVLFLIDEIMSGTNSSDRRVATEAVVRTLVECGAIGALSTHDLALTEIANADLKGVNVHMCSRGEGDPLDFDYLLKPGVNTEANALAIARLAGVV